MAKAKGIRIGDCVRLRADEEWAGTGKVTGTSFSGHSAKRDLFLVTFPVIRGPMRLKSSELKKTSCPAHLAGSRKKTRR